MVSAFIAPVSMSVPTAGSLDQQTHLCQINGNTTVNSSPAYHVSIPQIVLENKINEYTGTLDDAIKSAKNNFGIPQDYPTLQWFKDLNKSETSGKASDSKYIDTNGTCSTDYGTAFINTCGSFLNSFRQSVNNVASLLKVDSMVQPLTQSIEVH